MLPKMIREASRVIGGGSGAEELLEEEEDAVDSVRPDELDDDGGVSGGSCVVSELEAVAYIRDVIV